MRQYLILVKEKPLFYPLFIPTLPSPKEFPLGKYFSIIVYMGLRNTPLVGGEYYHLYNRGNDKRAIFLDDKDREHFVKLLYLCNSTRNLNFRDDIVEKKIDAWKHDTGQKIVSIGAWVIMPNHFHLYITSPIDPSLPKGNSFGEFSEMRKEKENGISVFMRKLCTSYTMYFNKKYDRTGKLFEGKFKSVHIKNDTQAKYLFSYIHLNPIKLLQKDWKERGILDENKTFHFLTDYQWSSYLDHAKKKRSEVAILSMLDFPFYFLNKSDLNREISEWIKLKQID